MSDQTYIVICTGNTCRSPMAEGILKQWLSKNNIDNIHVHSMGLAACDGDGASQYSIDAMKELEIDISEHRSRCALREDLLNANRIYVMTIQHRDVIVEDCAELEDRIVVIDVPDPFGQSFERYCACRDRIVEYFEQNPPVPTDV